MVHPAKINLTVREQSAKLRSPTLLDNRALSKLLITGRKLCTYQYLRGKGGEQWSFLSHQGASLTILWQLIRMRSNDCC